MRKPALILSSVFSLVWLSTTGAALAEKNAALRAIDPSQAEYDTPPPAPALNTPPAPVPANPFGSGIQGQPLGAPKRTVDNPNPQGPSILPDNSGWNPSSQGGDNSVYEQRVSRLEQMSFGSPYPEHEIEDRLDHLENEVFSKKNTGMPVDQRLAKLEAKLLGQTAFGQASAPGPPPSYPGNPGGSGYGGSGAPGASSGSGYYPVTQPPQFTPAQPVQGGLAPFGGGQGGALGGFQSGPGQGFQGQQGFQGRPGYQGGQAPVQGYQGGSRPGQGFQGGPGGGYQGGPAGYQGGSSPVQGFQGRPGGGYQGGSAPVQGYQGGPATGFQGGSAPAQGFQGGAAGGYQGGSSPVQGFQGGAGGGYQGGSSPVQGFQGGTAGGYQGGSSPVQGFQGGPGGGYQGGAAPVQGFQGGAGGGYQGGPAPVQGFQGGPGGGIQGGSRPVQGFQGGPGGGYQGGAAPVQGFQGGSAPVQGFQGGAPQNQGGTAPQSQGGTSPPQVSSGSGAASGSPPAQPGAQGGASQSSPAQPAPNIAMAPPVTPKNSSGSAANTSNEGAESDNIAKAIPFKSGAGDYFPGISKFSAGSVARWKNFPILVHIPQGSPPVWTRALEDAVAAWGKYLPVRVAAVSENADIEIGWINHLPPRALGQTNLEVFNGRMRVTVYLLRPSYYLADTPQKALRKVAEHEVGHAIGIFGHSNVPEDMMHPVENINVKDSTKGDGITARDLNTLRRIYESPALPSNYQSPHPMGWSLKRAEAKRALQK